MATGKVIWDAGHGGRDPGASSPSGLREKDLTLDVIQRIAGLENGFRGRVSFHFTRLTDTDLAPKAHAYSETADLSGRSTFANFVPRDPVREDRLFVSMHFNSEASRTAKGLSVWSYPDSTRGAYLARELLDEVGRQVRPWIGLHGGGLFTADFHVLRETAMPAVLVEAGFVGTQAEADHLAKPLVRQHIAEGAVLAVADIQGERYYFASDNNLDYEHFDLNTQSYATEEELERAFAGTEMAGLGTAFLRAEREHGLHAICFAAHAAWESAWGSSRIAREKHNLFGYGASDSDPYRNAYAFGSKEEGILFVAARVRRDYLNPTGQFHHGSNLRGMNVRYATDQNWRHGIARFWHRIRPFELRFGSGERGPRLEEPAPAPAPPAPAPAPTPTPDPSPTPDPTPTPDPAPVQPPGGFDPEQLKNLIGALKELLRILESILGRTST